MSVTVEPNAPRTRRNHARRGYAPPAVPTRGVSTQNTTLPGSDVVSAPPMGHRGPRVVRRAKALSWKSPEAFAALVASFFVSLACFYVAAYARVTAEGFEKAQLAKQLRRARLERESLEADLSKLTGAERVRQRAAVLGLIPNAPATTNLLSAAAKAEQNDAPFIESASASP